MKYNSSYLVCKEHIQEVKVFLSQFFQEEKDQFSHADWITFVIPDSYFKVSLMKGNDQDMTQNMTFEITCDTLDELKELQVNMVFKFLVLLLLKQAILTNTIMLKLLVHTLFVK